MSLLRMDFPGTKRTPQAAKLNNCSVGAGPGHGELPTAAGGHRVETSGDHRKASIVRDCVNPFGVSCV
jgi:hypothetical protein